MDIIMTANDDVLHFIGDSKIKLSKEMTEDSFFQEIEKKEITDYKHIESFKKSIFNYVVKHNSYFLIYNTLYNSLSRVSLDEFNEFENLSFTSDESKQLFYNQGFIINADINELEKYLLLCELLAKYRKSVPNITVTPTMKCNARCFYCYEKGVKMENAKNEDIDSIINVIKTMDTSNGIELTLFGGEPLLNVKWIDELIDKLKGEKIDFTTFIITNGSKIDDNIIKKMKSSWNITSVQITLDGDQGEYSKRKNYYIDDEMIYLKLLQIIGKLAKKEISVQIRLNIDERNEDSIMEAVDDINYLYGDKNFVSVYPAFLTGIESKLTEDKKIEIVQRLLKESKNFSASNYLYKSPRILPCYHFQDNAISIDTSGNIYSCEHHLGRKDYSIASIFDEKIEPNKKSSLILREECTDCVFLPKCLGGCNDSFFNGEEACFIDKYIIKAYMNIL